MVSASCGSFSRRVASSPIRLRCVANCSTFVFADVTADVAASAERARALNARLPSRAPSTALAIVPSSSPVGRSHDRGRPPEQVGPLGELGQYGDELLTELLGREPERPETGLELLEGDDHRGRSCPGETWSAPLSILAPLGRSPGSLAPSRCAPPRRSRSSGSRPVPWRWLLSLRRLAGGDVDLLDRAIANLGEGGLRIGADALDDGGELLQDLRAHRVELLGDATGQDANRVDRARNTTRSSAPRRVAGRGRSEPCSARWLAPLPRRRLPVVARPPRDPRAPRPTPVRRRRARPSRRTS